MDEQEQADCMAAAEALYMISTRGRKGIGEATTRRSKRGRKKKEIVDYDEKERAIHTRTSEDEEMGVKLKKQKRGQPQPEDSMTKHSDSRSGKVRTQAQKINRDSVEAGNFNPVAQLKNSRIGQRKKLKSNASEPSGEDNFPPSPSINEEIQSDNNRGSNRKQGKGKNKVQNLEPKSKVYEGKEEIKAVGFTGIPVTLSKSPPRFVRTNKPSSPRRVPSTNVESTQPQVNYSTFQLKSSDSTSLPSTTNLLSMNMSSPEAVNLPSLPAGIGSLQLSSDPMPNLSSLTESRRDEPIMNNIDREESQKQLPLKKRKLHSQVEEEKPAEDVSDTEEEVSSGQVRATFTVQAPPIITMQTLMEIKTALTPDEDGDLPLHIAVVHENMRMVTKLINLMRIAVKGVDKFNKQQQTPLHLAVKLNFVPAVDLLITSGANINTVDWTGSSAIHMAVQGGFYECLELLLKRCPQTEINARNFEGLSPLHLAVSNRDIRQVQLLLKHGADIDLPDGKSGRTALFHAAETNQKTLVELLLKQGANPELPNYAGVTTTMAAQGRNLHSILKLIGSVVQDKQDKWAFVTIKNQSGSVVEIKQSNDTVEVAPSPSLFQRSLSPSSQNISSDKTKTFRNMLVISEPDRKSAEIEKKQSLHTKTSSHTPEVKVEVEVLNSNGSSDSSVSQSQGSLQSLPLVNVKQEVMDTVEGSTSTATLSGNKYVVVSKSTGLPLSSRTGPAVSLKLNTTMTSAIPLSQHMRQVSLLHQTTPPKIQQLHQGVTTLSLPLSSSSSTPTSPRSPAAVNSDTVTLTSTQARLYKKLLEMYNINPAASVGQSTSPPVLKSLPIFSSTSSSPSPSRPPSSKDPSHPTPPLLSLPFLQAKSGHTSQEDRPPYLLQRSLSAHDDSRHTDSRTPPQKVSVLRVTESSFRPSSNYYPRNDPQLKSQIRYHSDLPHNVHCGDKEIDSDVPLNLSAKSDAAASYESNTNFQNGIMRNITEPPIEVQVSVVSSHSISPLSTTSLLASLKPQHSMPSYVQQQELTNPNNDRSSPVSVLSEKRVAEKMSVSLFKKNLSGRVEKETVKLDTNLEVPNFPHIAKSVTPETASFVRNFLSQQQQHVLKQHRSSPYPNETPSSHLIKSTSSSLPSSVSGAMSQKYPRTLNSINIPPLRTPSSVFSPSSTQSSSLPSSPSSAVSTLPLPLSQLDQRKQYVTLTKTAAGVVTVNSQVSSVSAENTDPIFLHQGRVIDLSTGDDSRGHDSKSANTSAKSKDMEGKMVGFSGAIISIPPSHGMEKPSIKSLVDNVKPEKTMEFTTVVKDKVKRKNKKIMKYTHSNPTPGEITQNKINHETDQRLKKFLGMKRSEITSSKSEKVKKENGSDATRTHSSVNSEGNMDNEPTIETVGIFSGNIQHVKVKPAPMKFVPSVSSKTGTVLRKPLSASPDQSNTLLSSSPKQHISSTSSLDVQELNDELSKVDDPDIDKISNEHRRSENDNLYYSERIVWRSSPLLPQAEEPDIHHKKLRKSSKVKGTEQTNAAVIVRPVQENTTFSSSFRIIDDSVDVDRNLEDNEVDTDVEKIDKSIDKERGLDNSIKTDKKDGSKHLSEEIYSRKHVDLMSREHSIGLSCQSVRKQDDSDSSLSHSSDALHEDDRVSEKSDVNREKEIEKRKMLEGTEISIVNTGHNMDGSAMYGDGDSDKVDDGGHIRGGSAGGEENDNVAYRHSVDEDQALVIDLETPMDKALPPPPVVAITTT